MKATDLAGLQDSMSSETPAHGDQDIALTRTPASVDQVLATGNQSYGTSSLRSDANDVSSKAVIPSNRPTIAPKQDSFRFLVTTNPTQFKDKMVMRENRKHVMNDFLRKERRKTPGTRDIEAIGPAEVEKRKNIYSYQREDRMTGNLLVPLHKLDTVAVAPAEPDPRTDAGAEDSRGAGKHRVAVESRNREARSHSLDGLTVSPESSLSRSKTLVPSKEEADLLGTLTDTTVVEHSIPTAIPRSPFSGASIDIKILERYTGQNGLSYHNTQRKKLEGYITQPIENTVLACKPIVEQSLATGTGFLALPRLDLQTLIGTPEPASRDHVRDNPFQQRLQQLVKGLAWEGERSPDSTSSITDTDDTSSLSGHSASPSGHHCHNGANNADSPDSSNNNIGSDRQHAFGTTSQTSYNQASDSSRTVYGSGPIQGYGDIERVRVATRQSRNDQGNGKVIPCPLRLELKCAGTDDNMSSLLRELSNSTHNIFYCNRCKSLLSRVTHTEDATSLRRLRKENKERWEIHIKSCHDGHCVMSACAPQPHGEVRHKHNENCKTNREDEKEADANYLYRKLGVAELGIENGIKTDHKGKRRSTRRKIVEVAEDAVQSNMELEGKLLDRNEELEMLRGIDRERSNEVHKLVSSNEELCSIIRHALEDMKREGVGLSNALQDRIKRHAPSALGNCFADKEPAISPTRRSQGPPYAVGSLSQAPVDTGYKRTNASNAMSNNVPNICHLNQDHTPIDTSSLLGPAAKRRRRDGATNDEIWEWPTSTSHLPALSVPVHGKNTTVSAKSTAGVFAFEATTGQELAASALAGASSDQSTQREYMASRQDHQQAPTESENDAMRSIGHPLPRVDTRSDSPVHLFDSSPKHNNANPPLPQLMSGDQLHPTQNQPPWMGFGQEAISSDFFDTISESNLWGDHFDRLV